MASSLRELMTEARAAVPAITAAEAKAAMDAGNVLVVDVRDALELQASGKVRGAVHVPRGLLEFRADPESPMHDPAFRKDRPVIVYCASGGRSALAGKTLKDFGFKDVRNLGGFQDWVNSGGAVDKV